jgi:hypothetical protein
MAFTWDDRTAQYRDNNGRFVSRSVVLGDLDSYIEGQKTKLRSLSSRLESRKITIDKFQKDFIRIMKNGHATTTMMGGGGRNRLDAKSLKTIQQNMKDLPSRIEAMGKDLAQGKLSAKQLQARMDNYGESIRLSFYAADKRSNQIAGKNQARRVLTPGYVHCVECIGHQSVWTDIKNIVPIGFDCSCQGRCKCRIFYRAYR